MTRYTNTQWMHDRITKGVVTGEVGVDQRPPDEIVNSRWDSQFEELMRNRLGFGHFRYGVRVDAGACFQQVSSAVTRLRKYLETGNQEHLLDAANLAMMEFGHPCEHDNPHFSASDDGEHTMEIT